VRHAPQNLDSLTDILSTEKISFGSQVTAAVGKEICVQFLAHRTWLRRRLESKGMQVREDAVFKFEMPNNPWELYRLTKALADQGINIISLYSNPKEAVCG